MIDRAPKTSALGRPAAGLSRYYMDCGWYRHPKFAGQPLEALFLFEAAVGYCTEHATDGRMAADLEQLSLDLGVRLSVVRKGAKALIDIGVWRHTGDSIVVVGWAGHNPTKGELDEYRQVKSKQGSYGNHRRWHVDRDKPDAECDHCLQEGLATATPRDRSSDVASDASLATHLGWVGMASLSEASRTAPPADPANGAGERSSHDEEDVLRQTWTRLAEHDLRTWLSEDETHRCTNRAGWLREAANRRRATHDHDARAELATQPGLTAEQLAEILDPACGPDDGGQARADRAAADTAARAEAGRRFDADHAAWAAEADRYVVRLDPDERAALEAKFGEEIPPGPLHGRLVADRIRQHVMPHRPEPTLPVRGDE